MISGIGLAKNMRRLLKKLGGPCSFTDRQKQNDRSKRPGFISGTFIYVLVVQTGHQLHAKLKIIRVQPYCTQRKINSLWPLDLGKLKCHYFCVAFEDVPDWYSVVV